MEVSAAALYGAAERSTMEPERIAGLLGQAEERISEFKKEAYADSFQKYLEDHIPVWNMINEACAADKLLQEQEQAMGQVADAFVRGACERAEAVRGRAKRETLQYNMNLYMVSYVLPAVIAWQKRCGVREEETKRLTDVICSKWEESFRARIQASDYESIQAGFKQKLCFVTTAVCRGLQKPRDCKEITLMKEFRDGYFSGTAEGRRLIQEYYDIAPTIVKRIAQDTGSEEKYLYLWNTYIRKCVEYIEREQNEQCSRLYQDMMSELKEEYMVTDRYRNERRPGR